MTNKPELLLSTPRFQVVEFTSASSNSDAPLRKQIVIHPGSVAIIPMVDKQHICLIRNHRIAVDKTLIELPAGTIDPPESPQTTAVRELQEETGYRAARLRELPALFMSPGILHERMHFFLAEDLQAGPPQREAGERIENLVVSWTEALEMVVRGDIEDAKTVAGLLLWDVLRRQEGFASLSSFA